jgi:hypothetical protein
MSDFPASTDERIKLLNRNEQDAKAVIDNETIPANLRFEAERTMLGQWLDNPELVQRYIDFLVVRMRLSVSA